MPQKVHSLLAVAIRPGEEAAYLRLVSVSFTASMSATYCAPSACRLFFASLRTKGRVAG